MFLGDFLLHFPNLTKISSKLQASPSKQLGMGPNIREVQFYHSLLGTPTELCI